MATSVRRRHAAVAIAIAIGVSGLLGFPGCGVAVAQDIIAEGSSDDWRWSITPYLWGSDIDTDISLPGGQDVGGTAKFDDILDKLDIGGMLHVEGRGRAWGMFVDATYLALSDDTTQGPFSVESELDTGLYEFAVTYTPGGDDGRFTGYTGARIIDLDLELTFSAAVLPEPIRRSNNKHYLDVMVGGRFVQPFNDRWQLSLQGDIGGGDTELSWNALALLGWKFGGDLDNAVLFGWRHMEFEIDSRDRETDITFDGPIAGVRFIF